MYKLKKIKLLHNEVKNFCIKIELLNFNFNLRLDKLDMVGSRLVLNGLIFSDKIPFDVQ